jgi:NAD+ kinase
MKLVHIVKNNNDDFYREVVAYLHTLGYEELAVDNYTTNAEFTLVLGGDGTVLAAGRKGLPNPFVVINTGHLGFLTSSDKENYRDTLLRFVQGSYTLTKRRTLRVRVPAFRPTDPPHMFDAVNEVVVKHPSKLVKVAVYVSDRDDEWEDPSGYRLSKAELLSEYRVDGLIVSTPTGSTAYNVSAGGPIIHPACDAFVITPICPQGLTQWPLVIPGNMKIRIKPLDCEMFVTVDGQDGSQVLGAVDVCYNAHCIETVNPLDTYFQILRKKLGWGIKPV